MFKVKKDHSDSMSLSKHQATHGNSLRETDKCRQLGEDEWPGSTTRSSENSSATDRSHFSLLGTNDLLANWSTRTLEALSEFETQGWQIHLAKHGAPKP